MKLTHVRIKDFRSFLGEHDFDVSDGINYFVGPNNCGKSNLLRAIALALDPDTQYIPGHDRPSRASSVGAPLTTRITLTFKVGTSGPERTLLDRAKRYELAVRKARGGSVTGTVQTYSRDREVRIVTSFAGSRKQVSFQAKGQGASSLPLDDPLHHKLEAQFRATVRFAVVRTGEDLESLLTGKFREILHLVISDHLKDELVRAEKERSEYVAALQSELLEPLRQRIQERVGGMFPEISVASLVPEVPTVAQTLSSVDVRLGDTNAMTQLAEKGTGVRGAVLVAMLRYLAEQSARSLVLAVEEPESFLHPAAQEAIREQLEELAAPGNVSLLITTHSPYIISRHPDALVRELRKDKDGWTQFGARANGDEERVEILGSLYRDSMLATVLERALRIPSGMRAVLVTEGYTDGAFLRMGCEAAGRRDLVDGLHIIHADGAKRVIVQAALAKSATSLPVICLLDFDEHGRSAAKDLAELGWKKEADLLSLGQWPGKCRQNHDVEVEDLIPASVSRRIVRQIGQLAAVDKHLKCGSQWHTSFSEQWKEAALQRLPELLHGTKETAGLVWLGEEINRRIEKVALARAKAGEHAAATKAP